MRSSVSRKPSVVRLDPDRLEADARRCAACGRRRRGSRPPRPRAPPVERRRPRAPPSRRTRLDLGPGADVDAVVLAQRLGHLLAGEGLLARQQPLARPRSASPGCRASTRPGRARRRPGRRRARSCSPGPASTVVASRLFQAPTESRPSIGGIAAPLPVATTTALRGDQRLVADDARAARRRGGPRRGRARFRVLPARAAGPSRRGRGSPRRGGRGPPRGRARR